MSLSYYQVELNSVLLSCYTFTKTDHKHLAKVKEKHAVGFVQIKLR